MSKRDNKDSIDPKDDNKTPLKRTKKPINNTVTNDSTNCLLASAPAIITNSVDDVYKELELQQHILLRPDSYVGGIDMITSKEWVPEEISDVEKLADIKRFVYRDVTYCPAALKTFDEVLVNARDAGVRDKGVTTIKVDINRFENSITVYNNSTSGIPIEKLKSGNYVPESTFGKLLAGQNFNDWEAKVTGGRNGFGAKLANIYSTEFNVDCTDTKNHLRFQQTYKNNMTDKSDPLITKYGKTEAYVKVKYVPDFSKLGGMKNIDDDFYRLMVRRTYDIAACTPEYVKIYLNGKLLKIRTFERYVDLFLGDKKDAKRVHIKLKNQITQKEIDTLCDKNQEERKKSGQQGWENKLVFKDVQPQEIEWEIVAALSDGSFTQTSFVNGIHTPEGGEHVNFIKDKVVKQIQEYIKNIKNKTVEKPEYIRNNLWLFVNATVINATFGGQTKRMMTLKPQNFFYKCKFPLEFVESFEKKCKITARVLRVSEAIELEKLDNGPKNRKLRKIKNLPKLQDAKYAGDPKLSDKCTLIVTEGDSAKTFACSGLNVTGTDFYGIFPLRGKPKNVSEMKETQLKTNEEYQNLLKILGLNEKDGEESINNMRYGKIMIMSDQDYDGYHIKLLLMNIFNERFPHLLYKKPGFIQVFVTPIVTCTPLRGGDKILFFSIKDFDSWKEKNEQTSYTVKYLKGLGTSDKEDAISYFENNGLHVKEYYSNDDTKSKDMFELAFSKKKIAERKLWLQEYNEKDVLDYSQPRITYIDGINRELKHFSTYSYRRAIPSVCDGLKTVQRKILWHMIQSGMWKTEKKVAQIKGSVADKADYHHGEDALAGAIINMAQNFPGSNNLNLLSPRGQFGSRLKNGNDASADRYIFTLLEPVVKHLFDQRDNNLLSYQLNDNEKPVEPTFYVTTIPMILVNGTSGIGTGYSTNMPSFNPLDLIDRLRTLIEASIKDINSTDTIQIEQLIPWYREFKGTIDKNFDETHFVAVGKWERIDKTRITVTELPVGHGCLSFQDYKEWLEDHLIENETKAEKQKKAMESESASRKRSANANIKSTTKRVTKDKYFIKEYDARLTDEICEFDITFKDESTLDDFIRQSGKSKDYAFERTMKLVCNIQYTNMMMFDENDKLVQFKSPEDIIRHFFKVRLDMYIKRKKQQIDQYTLEVEKLSEKVRFVEMVNDGKIKILKQNKQFIEQQLRDNKFKTFDSAKRESSNEDNDTPDNNSDDITSGSYKYLTSLPNYFFCNEKVNDLNQEKQKCLQHLETLRNLTPQELWKEDLKNLESCIVEQNEIVKQTHNYKRSDTKSKQKGAKNAKNAKSAKSAKK